MDLGGASLITCGDAWINVNVSSAEFQTFSPVVVHGSGASDSSNRIPIFRLSPSTSRGLGCLRQNHTVIDLFHIRAGTAFKPGLVLHFLGSERLTNEGASKENNPLSVSASAV